MKSVRDVYQNGIQSLYCNNWEQQFSERTNLKFPPAVNGAHYRTLFLWVDEDPRWELEETLFLSLRFIVKSHLWTIWLKRQHLCLLKKLWLRFVFLMTNMVKTDPIWTMKHSILVSISNVKKILNTTPQNTFSYKIDLAARKYSNKFFRLFSDIQFSSHRKSHLLCLNGD